MKYIYFVRNIKDTLFPWDTRRRQKNINSGIKRKKYITTHRTQLLHQSIRDFQHEQKVTSFFLCLNVSPSSLSLLFLSSTPPASFSYFLHSRAVIFILLSLPLLLLLDPFTLPATRTICSRLEWQWHQSCNHWTFFTLHLHRYPVSSSPLLHRHLSHVNRVIVDCINSLYTVIREKNQYWPTCRLIFCVLYVHFSSGFHQQIVMLNDIHQTTVDLSHLHCRVMHEVTFLMLPLPSSFILFYCSVNSLPFTPMIIQKVIFNDLTCIFIRVNFILLLLLPLTQLSMVSQSPHLVSLASSSISFQFYSTCLSLWLSLIHCISPSSLLTHLSPPLSIGFNCRSLVHKWQLQIFWRINFNDLSLSLVHCLSSISVSLAHVFTK